MTQDAQNVKLPAILKYAALGIPVFPLRPNEKKPIYGGEIVNGEFRPGGLHQATCDREKIEALHAATPEANWAINPGAADPPIFVVDCDRKKHDGVAAFAKLCAEHNWPRASVVTTSPSGGEHHWYQGDGPTSAGKLAPGVDTRGGKTGYIAVWPSAIDGKAYSAPDWDWLEIGLTPAPDALLKTLLAASAKVENEPGATVGLDSDGDVARGRRYLADLVARNEVAISGDGGNDFTYRTSCWLSNLGLSPEKVVELMLEPGGWNEACVPPWSRDELLVIATNAGNYAQNDAGVWAVGEPRFAAVAAELLKTGAPAGAVVDFDTGNDFDARVKQFLGRSPAEGAKLPPIVFLDPHGFFPLTYDGAVGYVYGTFGSLKTIGVAVLLLRRIKSDLEWNAEHPKEPRKVLRVLYAAGEGRHGFEKHRLPALADQVGLSLADLGRYWRTMGGAPNLTSGFDVNAFIAAARAIAKEHFGGEPADAVVFDTEMTVSGNLSEDDDTLGKLILANGPIGVVKAQLGTKVHIILAHSGKTEGRQLRGHSSRLGNADFGLEFRFEHDGAAGTLEIRVEKQKDGPDKFTIEFPVIVRADAVPEVGEGKRDAGKTGSKAIKDAAQWMRLPRLVGYVLKTTGIRNASLGISTKELISRLKAQGNDLIDGAAPNTLRHYLTGQRGGEVLRRRLTSYLAPRHEGDGRRWYFPDGELEEDEE